MAEEVPAAFGIGVESGFGFGFLGRPEGGEVVGEVCGDLVGVARNAVEHGGHGCSWTKGGWGFEELDDPLGLCAVREEGEVGPLSRGSGGWVAVAGCAGEFGVEEGADLGAR